MSDTTEKRLRKNLRRLSKEEREEWWRSRVEKDPIGAISRLCLGLSASADEECEDYKGQVARLERDNALLMAIRAAAIAYARYSASGSRPELFDALDAWDNREEP